MHTDTNNKGIPRGNYIYTMECHSSDTLLPEESGVGEQALLEAPGLASDLDVQPGQFVSGSGGLVPNVARFLCMMTTCPEDTRVRVRVSSDIPDMTNNFDETPQMPLSGPSAPGDYFTNIRISFVKVILRLRPILNL